MIFPPFPCSFFLCSYGIKGEMYFLAAVSSFVHTVKYCTGSGLHEAPTLKFYCIFVFIFGPDLGASQVQVLCNFIGLWVEERTKMRFVARMLSLAIGSYLGA